MRTTTIRRALTTGIAVTATALLIAACGGNDEGGHDGMDGMDGDTAPSSSSTATFNDADVAFAQGMIPHHQQAVEMATLAETQAEDPEIKELAAQIKDAQQPEIDAMTTMLTTWGQPVEPPMDHGDMGDGGADGMQSDEDMAALEAASGTAFDTMFAEMMIEHHEGAITMAQTEQTSGTAPEATALAGTIIETQTAEIETLKAILERL